MSKRDDFLLLLESLEIPASPLGKRSKRTPELEVLDDLRNHFKIPRNLQMRGEIADFLIVNQSTDDFLEFVAWLVRPFAQMINDVYGFLSSHSRTVGTSNAIKEIRIGQDIRFPVDLEFLPIDMILQLVDVDRQSWDIEAFSQAATISDVQYLGNIAGCTAEAGGRRCSTNCFESCRQRISDIVSDFHSLITLNEESEPQVLSVDLIGAMERIEAGFEGRENVGSAASDCIVG